MLPDEAAKIIELNSLLEKHSFLYHAIQKPEISDESYDQLYEQLLDLEKKYPEYRVDGGITSKVGSDVLKDGLEKYTHDVPLLSLKKAFTVEEVIDYLDMGKAPKVASPKLDGLALTLIYKNGNLVAASTRGNGTIGENVTISVKHIRNVPKILPMEIDIEVRGEVVIGKDAFASLNEALPEMGKAEYKNSRNAVSGILRSLTLDQTLLNSLAFYVYGCVFSEQKFIDDLVTYQSCINFMNYLGFSNKRVVVCKEDETSLEFVERTAKEFETMREGYDVDIDGIVYSYADMKLRDKLGHTDTYPRYAIAYKFKASSAISKLEEVVWSTGRTGVITPVAHVSPVRIHGVTIQRVTLHNVDEIKRLGVRIGDTISIERRGDVIPKIMEVINTSDQHAEVEIPSKCPSCGEKTFLDSAGVFLYCYYPLCVAQNIAKLSHFVSREAMNIDSLGEATLQEFVKKDFIHDALCIYDLHLIADLIAEIPGWGETSVNRLIESIEKSKRTTLTRLIYSLSIPGVGLGTAKRICKYFNNDPKVLLDINTPWECVDDIGKVTANAIRAFFSAEINVKRYNRLLEILELETVESSPSILNGEVYVFTGSFDKYQRKELEKFVERFGGKVGSKISKTTNYLVMRDPNHVSTKTKDAKSLGVPIISEDEFLAAVKLI